MTVCYRACLAAVALFALAYANPVSGAFVLHDESVDGDLPSSGSLLPNFVLNVGVNTVKGTTGIPLGGSSDFDSFAFTVPASTQLIAGSVTLTDSAGNGGDFRSASWRLRVGSASYNTGTVLQNVSSSSPGTYTFVNMPLSANVYNLSAAGYGYSSDGGAPKLGDYTFTFTVESLAAVPEPATFLIWGLVLAAVPFGAKARRRLVASSGLAQPNWEK